MDLTCARCGTSFSPSPQLLETYPGWRPKECPSCYRASKGSSGRGSSGTGSGGGRGSNGGHGASGRAGPRGAGREEHLTVAQVLDRYADGPDSGVFTDGSSIPNPGPGGWGAVYVSDGEVVASDHGHDPDTTNNRMELQAIRAGMGLVPVGTPATIHTDSNLAVRTLTEWASGWERRGWRRRTGPVENLDLVRPLYEALAERPELDLVWIRAHVGNRWNEYADALATAWARDEL